MLFFIVFLLLCVLQALPEMNFKDLLPSFGYLATAFVGRTLPQLEVLLLEFGVREDAELGLTRDKGQGVVGELDYHLTERAADPLGPDYLKRRRILDLGRLHMMGMVNRVSTQEFHATSCQ